MNCPKCKTKMYQDTDECRQTYSGSGVKSIMPELVYKCWNCSTRQSIERAPVINLTEEHKLNKLTKAALKDRTIELIRPFLPSIKLFRTGKKPSSWVAIATMIRQATGTRIKPETVQRNFERLNLQGVN